MSAVGLNFGWNFDNSVFLNAECLVSSIIIPLQLVPLLNSVDHNKSRDGR